ncbi:putative RNA-directed DNA polymerase from transposon BS [Nephila pilipes]|uniref:Putative RNA-directed DNA polymerase from transposon BS n=1 Tax=Nephila pilipes TaxID=299642 RepID=A0A8X6MAP5_NEPPI|nr:putative RNA-directed DNA polymerase from transposon BS [Nephila pilipes]
MKLYCKTISVFLDLSAAFDIVWHQKLIHICYNTVIKGNELIWNSDFLRDRKFSVRFNGGLSESHKLRAGVPQESVLSPLLFLIYMNTIHPHIHHGMKIAWYADYIAVWHSHIDTAVSEKVINATFEGIAAWAEDFKLTINADKINYWVFLTTDDIMAFLMRP